MSLVAYATSSDEEIDEDTFDAVVPAKILPIAKIAGELSNDEFEEITMGDLKKTDGLNVDVLKRSKILDLPPAKTLCSTDNQFIPFNKLPLPKKTSLMEPSIIEEEDDEFLKKKAVIAEIEKPPPILNHKVKIKIPALSDFKDVNIEKSLKPKTNKPSPKTSSLLNILPKPKSEFGFTNARTSTSMCLEDIKTTATVTSLIPESVKNRQRNKIQTNKLKDKPTMQSEKLSACTSDSDDDDTEPDFFSLHTENILPEVNINEINEMVAKRAKQMAQASSGIEDMIESQKDAKHNEIPELSYENEPVRQTLDQQAIEALVGTSRQAKRRKINEINVIDLSGEQVLPSRDEWLRTRLATATTYQPVGSLVDEELVPGTRRRHQITYLAHQAKANEAELQALWAANRQTKRQTQSKYGF